MDYLVQCSCGHSLEEHTEDGCAGTRGLGCSCRADRTEALNAAIDRARSDAAIFWRRPDETEPEPDVA